MSDYKQLRSYLDFKGQGFDAWLRRHRHLTLAQRQTAWATLCAEMQPIAHELRVYEEAAAYQKQVIEDSEWRGINP